MTLSRQQRRDVIKLQHNGLAARQAGYHHWYLVGPDRGRLKDVQRWVRRQQVSSGVRNRYCSRLYWDHGCSLHRLTVWYYSPREYEAA